MSDFIPPFSSEYQIEQDQQTGSSPIEKERNLHEPIIDMHEKEKILYGIAKPRRININGIRSDDSSK